MTATCDNTSNNPIKVTIVFDDSTPRSDPPDVHYHQQCLGLDCPHVLMCEKLHDGREIISCLSCYGEPSEADWPKIHRYAALGVDRATHLLHAEMDMNHQEQDFEAYRHSRNLESIAK